MKLGIARRSVKRTVRGSTATIALVQAQPPLEGIAHRLGINRVAVVELRIADEMEGPDGLVGAGFPSLGQPGDDLRRAVHVFGQRVVQRLLDQPRGEVIAHMRVQDRHRLAGGEDQDLAVAVALEGRRGSADGDGARGAEAGGDGAAPADGESLHDHLLSQVQSAAARVPSRDSRLASSSSVPSSRRTTP
jgi:hypothetical protein